MVEACSEEAPAVSVVATSWTVTEVCEESVDAVEDSAVEAVVESALEVVLEVDSPEALAQQDSEAAHGLVP